ncbi:MULTISPECIES: amidohydrolase family protein [unclassified Methanoregula]|uniref:amidohydrolase family protein n=1 Tax=unclassified Methanoregula TaxID=2649730 RepID=UPI0009D571C4|nr:MULTISPECIES: amidohydrolase family protein [unclassified Methanoregula]OPX63870.1 MAG: chlorohydrolase [Methanoregula sp. PtaB.Bin085]OPY35423.1 MAG: chlorohydrolase [Methanoregula sp. PtaU1.Bin006]
MKMPEKKVSGYALLDEELALSPVDMYIENGTVTAIEENSRAPQIWIFPALYNAHTHLGDTIAMDCGTTGSLADLVAPPDGLKHRLLRAAPREDIVGGMRAGMEGMIAAGTAGCADFREGGIDGVRMLEEAARGLPFRPFAFGREGGETVAGGLGISSTRDVPDAGRLVAAAKKAGKKIAFHAGERDSADIDDAIGYGPDLLVHMTHATKKQLRECAERDIPIAVCPRSNWILGVTSTSRCPPLALMEDLGCTVCLGTDNAMFVPPDLFSEMAFVSAVYRLPPPAILRAAVRGSAVTGPSFFIRKGGRANLFTVDPARSALRFSRDPLATLVKRADRAIIRTNVFTL